MKKIILIIIMLVGIDLSATPPSYKVRNSVIGASNLPTSNSNNKVLSTVGQGYKTGVSSNANNKAKSGFWYQMDNAKPEVKSIEITDKTSSCVTISTVVNAGGSSANVRLQYATSESGPWTTLTFSASPISSRSDEEMDITICSLLVSKQYFFKVKLESSEGDLYSETLNTWTRATTNSKSITYHSITKNRIGLRWTKGDGNGRIVVAKKGSAISSGDILTDGETYTISDVYGQGSAVDGGNAYVVFGGDNTTCLVNGLDRNTTYHFRIFEYSGDINQMNSLSYIQTTTSGNPSSKATNKKDVDDPLDNDYLDLVSLHPNPTTDYIMLNLNVADSNPLDVSIFDLNGNEIYSIKNQVYSKGLQSIKIDTKEYVSGAYTISISQGNELMMHSFVVEK